MRWLASLAGILVSSCAPTLDDLRTEPVRWTAEYDVPYDTLTNCLAARMSEKYSAVPQVYPRDRIGIVTVTWPQVLLAPGGLFSEYTIRSIGADRSSVEWRRRKMGLDLGENEQFSKDAAARCAEPPK